MNNDLWYMNAQYIVEEEHRKLVGENRQAFQDFSDSLLNALPDNAINPEEATIQKELFKQYLKIAKDRFGEVILACHCVRKVKKEEKKKKDDAKEEIVVDDS